MSRDLEAEELLSQERDLIYEEIQHLFGPECTLQELYGYLVDEMASRRVEIKKIIAHIEKINTYIDFMSKENLKPFSN